MPSLPVLLYGTTSIVSALMVLQFPETFNTKLPDTIEEAVNIGKKSTPDVQDTSVRKNLV